MQAYDALAATFARLRALDDAAGILGWDSQTLMPAGAAEGRAEQLAVLRATSHEILVAPRTADLLAQAREGGGLGAWEAANLREMTRLHVHAAAVPGDLVVAMSHATSTAEMAWRTARANSDFALLRPHLEAVLAAVRAVAQAKGAALGIAPYDALLDGFDPGLRSATIDPIFDQLRAELPPLVAAARERQAACGAPLTPASVYPVAAQRALGESLMRKLGFDFDRGRLDTSLHPFCGGATGDVRITTRYRTDDFGRALMGVLHETGHALYEQGRPRPWLTQPVGDARGMILHESQSLLVEMQVCRSAAFMAVLSPLLIEHFGTDPALAPANLQRLHTWVEPGFIRVDADELTYPLHILLRTELERAMLDGTLAVADLPAAFNAGMKRDLDLDVPDDAHGCLQDIHWPSGGWGYFPTYTLGAMAAAQLFEAACTSEAAIPPGIAAGDFSALVGWLRARVHGKGSLQDTQTLLAEATGRSLGTESYLAHLRRRYVESPARH